MRILPARKELRDFIGAPLFMPAQLFANGAPVGGTPGISAIHLNLQLPHLVFYNSAQAFPTPGLPASGLEFELLVPPGLGGSTLRIQGGAITPLLLRSLPRAGSLPYNNKNLDQIGKLDPLIVGRAHVVYERGERPGALL